MRLKKVSVYAASRVSQSPTNNNSKKEFFENEEKG